MDGLIITVVRIEMFSSWVYEVILVSFDFYVLVYFVYCSMFVLNKIHYKDTKFVNRLTNYMIIDISLRGATLSLVCKFIRF